jgi:hypothetical protein
VRTADQSASDAGGADIDNALSAVAKMIKVAPQLLPVGQILPVLLAALPLRDDTTEGPCVYGMLHSLIMANHPDAVPLLLQIVARYFEVLSASSSAVDETKVVVRAALKALASSPYAQVLNDAFAQVRARFRGLWVLLTVLSGQRLLRFFRVSFLLSLSIVLTCVVLCCVVLCCVVSSLPILSLSSYSFSRFSAFPRRCKTPICGRSSRRRSSRRPYDSSGIFE